MHFFRQVHPQRGHAALFPHRHCVSLSFEAQEGWSCVGIDVNLHQDEQIDSVLQKHQQMYKLLQADISDENSVKAAIQEASAFLNKSINCLVNNAGAAVTS